jgi:hypothetical protein
VDLSFFCPDVIRDVAARLDDDVVEAADGDVGG